jgi:transcriptional regulator with XRE-family HTH domain
VDQVEDNDSPRMLGTNLRKFRDALKWTQETAARRAQSIRPVGQDWTISHKRISDWEKHRHAPEKQPFDSLIKAMMAQAEKHHPDKKGALGIPVPAYLMNRDAWHHWHVNALKLNAQVNVPNHDSNHSTRQIFGAIPPLAGAFQLRSIARNLAPDKSSKVKDIPIVSAYVLSGLGGVGKTQLAASHAHGLWDSNAVDLLVWIPAQSRDGILSAYYELAVKILGVQHSEVEQALVDSSG